MKKQLEIMDDIIGAISDTNEWRRIQMEDPSILAAEEKVGGILDRVKPLIPRELFMQLSDAITEVGTAYHDPAILYGIQVAQAIHDVVLNPTALSRHILNRIHGE